MFGKSIFDRIYAGKKKHKLLTLTHSCCSESSMDIGGKREMDRVYCQELATHLIHFKSLPEGCKQYKDIASDLKRRDSDTTHPTQYLS